MFRAVCRPSSGAPTVFAASGLHTHVVTARSQFPPRLDYGRSPHAYVNQRLQIQLGLLMMCDIPLETCWACNELWNNKFRYQIASCWLLLLSHTTMHGSMNIKFMCVCVFVHIVLILRTAKLFGRNIPINFLSFLNLSKGEGRLHPGWKTANISFHT